MKRILLFLITALLLHKGYSQVPTCESSVPYFNVDLTGYPAGVWISPWHERNGHCCTAISSDRCTSFDIILDPNAAMINFEIIGGAIPSGSMYYQINCGPPVAVGSPICISGTGPFHVTFCKPGNNENIYRITSIPKPTFPNDDTVRIGCQTYLDVLGLESPSISWQSIYPGTLGQYNSYLSCITGCASPLYTPAIGAPAYIDYKICGNPIADECGYIALCDTIRIYNFSSMTGSVSPTSGTFCSGSPGIMLTASGIGGDGSYSYIWRDPTNTIVGSTSSVMANVAGTWTVEIRDGLYDPSLCPPVYISIPVIEVFPPVVNAGNDLTLCADNPIANLNASFINCAGVSWTGGLGTYTPSPSSATLLYNPTPGEITFGSVTLYATSTGAGGGCVNDTDTVKIIYPPMVTVSLSSSGINCFGNTTTISTVVSGGAGTVDLLWNTGAITASINTSAGNYCVSATDTLGCIATACQNITTPDPLTISMSSVDATAGSNGQAIASVLGGTTPYTYLWNDPLYQTTATATGLSPGMYTVTVTDDNGCNISSSVIVNSLLCSGLQANATSTNVSCNGAGDGTGFASAIGGTAPYTYSWQSPLSSTNDTVTGLNAGTYLVIVQDFNGCMDAASITIIEPLQITNILNHTDVTTTGGTDGTASASTAGGVLPYTYLWSNGSTGSSVGSLSSGVISVSITDSKGCILEDSVRINEPNCTNFIIGTSVINPTCNGLTNGSATVTVLSGDPSYTYVWNTGSSSPTITGLSAGSYSITVTDSKGCETFQNVIISQPSLLSVVLVPTQSQCNNSNNGTIELNVSGGTYPYTYLWSNGIVSEDLYSIPPGLYSVNVTDANSCIGTQNTIVSEPDSMATSVTLINATCHNGNDGFIDLTVAGGTGLITYLWSNGQTTQDLDSLISGTYTLQITDQNGCNNEIPIEVFINEPTDVFASANTIDCPIPGSGVANVTITPSGGSGSTYQISFDNGLSFTSLGDYSELLPVDSTYYILVKDTNSCISPITDTITILPDVIITNATFNHCFVQGDSTVSVTITITGGNSSVYNLSYDNGLSFQPNNEFTFDLAIDNPYSLIGIDSLGCESMPYNITIPAILRPFGTLSQYNLTNVSCYGANDGSINVSVSGGTFPYTYSWSSGQSTEDISGIDAGSYTISVTDSLGCTNDTTFVLTQPDSLISSVVQTTNFNGYNVSFMVLLTVN